MSDTYDPLLDAINLRRRTQPLTPFQRLAGTRAKLTALLMPPDERPSTVQPRAASNIVPAPPDLAAAIRAARSQE